ncbi:MAG: hypothetical protein V7677_10385 [Motiliproteus sp.]
MNNFSITHQIKRAVIACEIDTNDLSQLQAGNRRDLYLSIFNIEANGQRYSNSHDVLSVYLDLIATLNDDDLVEYFEELHNAKHQAAQQRLAELFFSLYGDEIQQALDESLREITVERAINSIAGYAANARHLPLLRATA